VDLSEEGAAFVGGGEGGGWVFNLHAAAVEGVGEGTAVVGGVEGGGGFVGGDRIGGVELTGFDQRDLDLEVERVGLDEEVGDVGPDRCA
jgi:hypothetical protein